MGILPTAVEMTLSLHRSCQYLLAAAVEVPQ